MDETPILNEAIGFGEAIPDPKPTRICDVWGYDHKWKVTGQPLSGHWLCACGETAED